MKATIVSILFAQLGVTPLLAQANPVFVCDGGAESKTKLVHLFGAENIAPDDALGIDRERRILKGVKMTFNFDRLDSLDQATTASVKIENLDNAQTVTLEKIPFLANVWNVPTMILANESDYVHHKSIYQIEFGKKDQEWYARSTFMNIQGLGIGSKNESGLLYCTRQY